MGKICEKYCNTVSFDRIIIESSGKQGKSVKQKITKDRLVVKGN